MVIQMVFDSTICLIVSGYRGGRLRGGSSSSDGQLADLYGWLSSGSVPHRLGVSSSIIALTISRPGHRCHV
jgi:hypothetical protein